jgi:hypothetical protein
MCARGFGLALTRLRLGIAVWRGATSAGTGGESHAATRGEDEGAVRHRRSARWLTKLASLPGIKTRLPVNGRNQSSVRSMTSLYCNRFRHRGRYR